MKPTLQILIPAYNCQKEIIETLNSIKKSKQPIIISDNNSNDSTVDLIKNFSKTNNNINIKLLRNKKTLSVTENIKKCIKSSRADFVMLLSSNDIVDSKYLSKAELILNKNKINLLLRNYNWFYKKKKTIVRKKRLENFNGYLNIYDTNHFNIFLDKIDQLSGIIFRRKIALKYLHTMQNKSFIEFPSLIINFYKYSKIFYLDNYYISVRSEGGGSNSKNAYSSSPFLKWKKLLYRNFSEEIFIKCINIFLSSSFFSLVQLKIYGTNKLLFNEIFNYIKINKLLLINLKFLAIIFITILLPRNFVNHLRTSVKIISYFRLKNF
jgi:glycosyltransferase involved in cell wall biosynthesis